jgi:hypothetical protein
MKGECKMKGLKVFLLCVILMISGVACSSNGQSQLPNPIVDYDSIEDVQKAVDFDFDLLGNIPKGFTLDSTSVINKQIAQIIYKNGEDRICYRVAKGSDDISGDYNEYPVENSITIGNCHVLLRGAEEKINLATWEKDGLSFAVSFNEGMAPSAVEQIIVSVL